MENTSEVITRITKKRELSGDGKKIARAAVKRPSVQAFLTQNKDKSSGEIVQVSLPTIFNYVERIEAPNLVVEGHTPKFFLNGEVVDTIYVSTGVELNLEAKTRAERGIESTNPPGKLRHVELENVDLTPERDVALNEVAMFLTSFERNKHIEGLCPTSDFGIGKTHILAGLANAITRQGSRVVLLHVLSFIASLGGHFQDNNSSDGIDHIALAPILASDDIGAEALNERSCDDVLGVILQKHTDSVLLTFLSLNMTTDNLAEYFAEAGNNVDEVETRRSTERARFLSKEVLVDGKNHRSQSQISPASVR